MEQLQLLVDKICNSACVYYQHIPERLTVGQSLNGLYGHLIHPAALWGQSSCHLSVV